MLVHDACGDALSWFTVPAPAWTVSPGPFCVASRAVDPGPQVLVYLNEGFGGGATRLYGAGDAVDVVPATGAALLFPHGHHADSVFHEGRAAEDGVKYVLRTDVLYESKVML